MKAGTVVHYSENGTDEKFGFFKKHDGDKDVIQTANGDDQRLAYREPEDRDSGGSGTTWWTVK